MSWLIIYDVSPGKKLWTVHSQHENEEKASQVLRNIPEERRAWATQVPESRL